MRKLTSTAAALTAAGALLLTACGGSGDDDASATPRPGGTLVYATGDDEPTCLDPQQRGNVPQALLATQYLQTLFFQDDKGEILPWLATSWTEAPDHLSWTVELRDDVRFSDGTPFDAAAVKTNIERVLDPETGSTTGRLALSKVAAVQVPAPHTARIELKEPDSALLESLSMVWLPMQSPAALARGLTANCESPVGTGPFTVESWHRQDSVTLVRNANFTTPPPGSAHTGPAYLDRITWRFVPDGTSRFAALQSGQADVVDVLEPQHAVAAKGNPNLAVTIAARPGKPVQLELNTTRAPFDDASVREAFWASVDIDAALASVYLGTTERATSPLSSSTRYAADTIRDTYDPAKAAALLDAAGWTGRDGDGIRTKDGRRLTVSLPYTTAIPLQPGVYEQIQATAKKSGFDVELRPLDTAKWWIANNEWDYDALPMYYTKNSPDVLRITYHSAANADATPNSYHANNVHLADPEVDRLLTEAGQTTDEAVRADLYRRVQQTLADGHYILPVHDQQTRIGAQKKVKGIRLLPSLALPSFYDTWIG
ncbi:ABC transporter substrate-binding protein [Yinghuangia sp. ASG 101]|uniref:ABC transporter substrate-binding protein n=1 Tax=Yinghuangia sp. ASG 101 TaxID=2896848 RepID=UPI001E4CBC33|nr:ABC transporter substrate-binding protein [Yinghuangia sp. ASG 101]UGQ11968.1 ABC transporter substrate-binding protein [Yinghuangia sp. ASG 101]